MGLFQWPSISTTFRFLIMVKQNCMIGSVVEIEFIILRAGEVKLSRHFTL
jgi:hypothetical protein